MMTRNWQLAPLWLMALTLAIASSSDRLLGADETDTKGKEKKPTAAQKDAKDAPAAKDNPAAKDAPAEKPAPPKRTADVVYVATPHDVVAKMLELAKVTKKDVVYDLGCGDGRIVVTAAKKFGCKGTGYDLDDDRVAESKANIKKSKVEALVDIKQEDVFTVDLTKASVITLYLLPEMNVKLIPQLEKLKPGSRIVAHDFDIRGVKPDQTIKMISREDGVEHKVFLWTLPLKKE